jgi:hypothetical protein
MLRVVSFLVFALLLAGCQTGGERTEAINAQDQGAIIQWDRDPSAVVFRADVVGGETDPFFAQSEVPLCTVYGDNRVVWTVDTEFGSQVWIDRLEDQTIIDFVGALTVNDAIYRYDAQAAAQPEYDVSPVYEQLTLNVNGQPHVTDSFSGWDFDYFSGILNRCRELGRQPAIFEPLEAWVSVRDTSYDSTSPEYAWSARASGVDLAALAESGDRAVVNGRIARVLWNIIHRNPPGVQLNQDDEVYHIALSVPNITRSTPEPPSS